MYILWPSFRPNGDPLLYLTGQPLVEGKGRCAFVADVNPYGLEVIHKSTYFHFIMRIFESLYCYIFDNFYDYSLMLEVDELHMPPLAPLHFKTFPKTKQMKTGRDLNDISKILF